MDFGILPPEVISALIHAGPGAWSWIAAAGAWQELSMELEQSAADYSADACRTAGGIPRPFAGASQRGTCSSEWSQDEDGSMMYRCYGEASVWCR